MRIQLSSTTKNNGHGRSMKGIDLSQVGLDFASWGWSSYWGAPSTESSICLDSRNGVSKSQSNLNWFSNFYASITSIESQSLSSRWRTPPGFGEGWSHGNHRQGISAQRGGADYLNFTMNLMPRCGPLGHKYVQPTWETTYSKTYRKPTTTSTTQYFTKSVR